LEFIQETPCFFPNMVGTLCSSFAGDT
jgi:hypothetical protein